MAIRNRKIRVTPRVIQSLLLAAATLSMGATHVNSIDFKVVDGKSELTIQSDSELNYERQDNPQDKQIVLELKDTVLDKTASRNLDTSSFNSPVKLVSPYQLAKQDDQDNARLVVQLKDNADAVVTQNGNTLKIVVPGGAATQDVAQTEEAPTDAAPIDAAPIDEAPAESTVPTPVIKAQGTVKTTAEIRGSVAVNTDPISPSEKKLDDFLSNRGTRPFEGKTIRIHLKDADLADVFRLISDASGFNILIGDDVKGKVTLELDDVPWDQVLDMILHTYQLGAVRNNNVLRVMTLANQTRELQQEQQAKVAMEASAPRITKIFKISHAKLADVQTILARFGTTANTGTTQTTSSSLTVQADERTNQLIVRDTQENLAIMEKLVQVLDVQPPQVLIEAKVVEATEEFGRTIGGQLGTGVAGTQAAGGWFASARGANPLDSLLSAGGSTLAGLSGQGIALGGFAPNLGIAKSPGINAMLQMEENEGNTKTVSAPRTVVINRETASITQSTPVTISISSVSSTGVIVPTQSVVNANISLNVQPTVTNEGSILMDLTVTRDVALPNGVGNRNMKTKVLVDSGNTLVLGGIYIQSTTKSNAGVPWLRKIPILGYLFSTENENESKSELFFFVTPKIINEKEAGLSGQNT